MHSTHDSTWQCSAQPPHTRAKPTGKAMCAPAYAGKSEILKTHACPHASQAAAAVPGAGDTPPPASFFTHMGRALAEMYAGEFRIPLRKLHTCCEMHGHTHVTCMAVCLLGVSGGVSASVAPNIGLRLHLRLGRLAHALRSPCKHPVHAAPCVPGTKKKTNKVKGRRKKVGAQLPASCTCSLLHCTHTVCPIVTEPPRWPGCLLH